MPLYSLPERWVFGLIAPISMGVARIFGSLTSTVTRHVRLCCWRDFVIVGNSLRTVTIGAGILFGFGARGLASEESID
jgi:hypothetical protein